MFSGTPKFPSVGINPKVETQVKSFLEKYEKFDGRGIVVAILDTGCDPMSEGLRTTSEGRVKFIDVVDATGSGDIDTSTVVKSKKEVINTLGVEMEEKSDSRTIEGLTGRKLKIPDTWINPSGEWHVGYVQAYTVFPEKLKNRLIAEDEIRYKRVHKQLSAQIARQVVEAEKAVDAAKSSKEECIDKERSISEAQVHFEDIKERKAQLAKFGGDKVGPFLDCVVWNDGTEWLGVLSDEHGGLEDARPVTNYKVRHELVLMSKQSMCYYACNIYDDGNILSCVVPSGNHGTHVAGIVGAYFPETPEMNGMAPGCQMISIKIGDTRLESMESIKGLTRAARVMKEYKVHLMNMSYGESARDSTCGRFKELLEELTNEYGLISLNSAGNDGPCLSTTGAPCTSSSSIIGVGAMVTSQMVQAQYNKNELIQEPNAYTWCSRAPTSSGFWSLMLNAPGGAISPVPQFNLSAKTLMNGTSMASPNACGSIACLLCGLEAMGIDYNPHTIKRALFNTCRQIASIEPWAAGNGLIQIEDAFNYCQNNKKWMPKNFRIEITMSNSCANSIYARDWDPKSKEPLRYTMHAKPKFPREYPPEEKLDMEFKVSLVSKEPWITPAKFVLLNSAGRGFDVTLDQNHYSVKSGENYGEVHGVLADYPEMGPLFKIPVTLIKPLTPSPLDEMKWQWNYEVGQLRRHFIRTPMGVSYAGVTVKGLSDPSVKRRMVLQCATCRDGWEPNYRQFFLLYGGDTKEWTIALRPGLVTEFTLAQYCLSMGNTSMVEIEIKFKGVDFSSKQIYMQAQLTSVYISSMLRRVSVTPVCRLKSLLMTIVPEAVGKVTPGGCRDISVSDEAIYKLDLSYKWEQPQKGKVAPRFPKLDGILYSFPWDHKMWMLYDSNKKLICTGDLYEVHKADLGEQKYELKLQIQHTDQGVLKGLESLSMLLETELKEEVEVPLYSSRNAQLTSGKKLSQIMLNAGERKAIYFGEPKSYPKCAKPGNVLKGFIKSHKLKDGKVMMGDYGAIVGNTDEVPSGMAGAFGTKVTAGAEVYFTVPPTMPKAKPKEEPPKPTGDEVAVNSFVAMIKKMSDKDLPLFWETYGKRVASWFPENLKMDAVAVKAAMKKLEADNKKDKVTKEEKVQNIRGVLELVDEVISRIDQEKLAEYVGLRKPATDPGSKKLDEDYKIDEERKLEKTTLISMLKTKVELLIMELTEEQEDQKEDDPSESFISKREEMWAYYQQLTRWIVKVDKHKPGSATENMKHDDEVQVLQEMAKFKLWRAESKNYFGQALNILEGQISKPETKKKADMEKRLKIMEKLGWGEIAEVERRRMLVAFPKKQRKI